jgi:hypothetical protein
MRRIAIALALAGISAAALAAPAAAKWTIELGSTPAGIRVGDPWRLEIAAVGTYLPRRSGPPVVRIRHVETGSTRAYRAEPVVGQSRRFVTTIRFPREGRWRYTVRYASAKFGFGPVHIEPGAPHGLASTRTSGVRLDDGGFPLWPMLGGIAGAAVLGAAGLAWTRVHRLPPWPATSSSARTASRGR